MLNAEIQPREILTGVLQKDTVSLGGGTSDYNELNNKPSINGVILEGDKTTEELGIVSKETDPTVPDYVKNITEENIDSWNNKATTDYVDEQVDDVREVAEGKTKSFTVSTLSYLGTLLGIDTSVVANEYAITSTTIIYKEQSIELKQGDLFLIVDTNVPDYWVSVDDMKIYKMETTKVDLTDYVKNTDYGSHEKAGIYKLLSGSGIWKNSDNALYISSATNADIDSKKSNYKPIVPLTLDYAIKVGLTTNTETLTEEEKTAIQNWLGIGGNAPVVALTPLEDGSYSLDITTTDTISEALDRINGEVV